MQVTNLDAIRIKLASPEEILSWGYGEVTRPETINYRTQKPEKDGLFCERIFGPEKDYECACGKYKRIRYKGIICDRCGVEVTKSQVRRERLGYIKLATPVSHIWFLRGVPSRIGMILDKPSQQLERVIYFSAYIITKVDENAKKRILEEIEKEYERKIKKEKTKIKKQTLKQLKEKVREEVLGIKPLRILSEVTYRELSLKYGEIFEAGTGAEVLRKIFEEIDLKKISEEIRKKIKTALPSQKKKFLVRLKFIKGMIKAKIRPEWMFLTVLPVLPPDLRPMVQLDGGRYASSDLNDLYRRVINRNNRLKYLLEISAPEVIIRNEKRMLQEAVDALIDNDMRKGVTTTATTGGKRLLKSLADMLQGKQGRFRQNLLGKRVDYSGRSVIAVGPELKFHQCGLPKTMALEIFRPFVIKRILDKELAYNIKGANRLIAEKEPEVWAILEEIVKDKLVLLNRAPTLHRLGIQAFQPVLIEGETIKIHPLVCEAYNADFDGDQMAVYLPLSEEAQKEAREIMLSSLNLLRPATGTPIIGPYRDIVLGCYYLTTMIENNNQKIKIFSSVTEAKFAYENGLLDLREKIKLPDPKNLTTKKTGRKLNLIETTLGRVIFNENLPNNFPYLNKLINLRTLKELMLELIEKYPPKKLEEVLDKIKDLGFEFSTLSGISWGMDDLIIPKEKEELIAQAKKEITAVDKHFKRGFFSKREKISQEIFIWQGVKSKIEKLLKKTLPPDGSVYSIVEAGSRASWAQPVQMAGMKGLAINPAGEIIKLPITSSFKEGFSVLEYFISTHGGRKGTVDTALRTSTAGYLTRRLIDVAHDVIIMKEDCGDLKGITLFKKDAQAIDQDFVFKIVGRISLETIKKGKKILVKKGEIIDWKKAREIEKEGIEKILVRSPLSCKLSRGICQKCYGWDLGKNKLIELGEAVGVVAAQSIGEPGTQLTLRTFHLGGVAGTGDITLGLPRIEEIFEVRPPRQEALMALSDGRVVEVDSEKGVVKIETKRNTGKKEIIEYKTSGHTGFLIKQGDKIKKGQLLSEGSLDLKKLFKVLNKEQVQRYIIQEIQKIYVSQGVNIHDKHIEIIVYKMFSRRKIKDEGDSNWSIGEIVENSVFQEEVLRLRKAKKKPPQAQPILLGISDVALTSDSFLSAASFQQTSRVLIKASLEGKEDKLRGLKENVIIGKLIPVGTGFRK